MAQGTTANKEVVWVGMDVHKETVTVAAAQGWTEPRLVATVANDGHQLPKLLRRLAEKGELRCAYEAGACGYDVYRLCEKLGINCVVIAPSLIPTKPGDRVKTDRRDARKLCRCLRSGDLTPIWVPDAEHEALRDLVRAREDALEDRMRARHRIKKMLLRQGIRRPEALRSWSKRHRAWLDQVSFTYLTQQMVERGFEVVGIDSAPTAIGKARAKANQRRLSTRFEVAEALDLPTPQRPFDTVIDSGLFHVFSDDERVRFRESLISVIHPRGTYLLMCFSEEQPGNWGPRRVTRAEIRSTFESGWRVNYIQPATLATNEGTARAWLASISRSPES